MPTDGNNNQATDNNDQKVTFTPEQQARIDEIVREAMGRAGKEARQTAEHMQTQMTDLKTQLSAAQEALSKAKTPAQKAAAGEDIDALKGEISEMKRIHEQRNREYEGLRQQLTTKDQEIAKSRDEAVNIRKQVAMRDAAGKGNFVDVGIVTQLTDKNIKYDSESGKFVVLTDDGTPRMNAAYQPMGLDEFFVEYAAKNPFLVRGDMRSGVGSTEQQRSGLSNNGKYTVEQLFGKNSNAMLANKLKKENPAEYARLKVVARESGLRF